MPIDYGMYGREFLAYSRTLRMYGKCAVCGAENRAPHPETGSEVVLTVQRVDGDISNNGLLNLVPLCQKCHLAHHRGGLQKLADPVTRDYRVWLDGLLEFVMVLVGRDQVTGMRDQVATASDLTVVTYGK